MIKRKVLRLDSIRVAVLDEADRMLDMGFIDDVKEILSETPEFRQTLLFSATMPDEIKHLAKTYMKNPESLTVSTDAVPIDRIKQTYIVAEWKDKLNALLKILDREKPELAIVFVKTKFEASKLAHKLTLKGHNAISLHGNLSQNQRDKAMHLFRHGHARILVATDIAARGIDVTGITHIINYDLPMDPNTYSHRLGRTARAGAEGKGITLVTPEQRREIRDIQRAAGVVIEQEDIEGKPVQDTNEEEATLTNFGEGSYGTGFFKTTRHEAIERRTSWKRDSRRQRTSHPRGGYHKHKYKR
jgi:ATP-dependent RNA helicase DeaD